jgi:hypothetical protein
MQRNQKTNGLLWRNLTGTRLVVAAFGILCGLTGIITGYFETLQGNVVSNGLVISTIGPSYIMPDDFTNFAVTIIPNLLITGIFSIIVSSMTILWSVRHVHKKNGALILLGLSVTQMFVGGGWVIDLALMTCILATRIDKPLNWWRKHLPTKLRIWLARIFPTSIVVYALISVSMLVLTIQGGNSEILIKRLEPLAAAMFIPMALMIFGGLAHDVERRTHAQQIRVTTIRIRIHSKAYVIVCHRNVDICC